MGQEAKQLPLADGAQPLRRPVNIRSVALGLLGVLFICGLTAYNDYVVENTFMVGNFLPIGLLLFFLTFILLINAPLRRWAPRQAMHTGELGVALCMMLVSCALPSSGLMRYLPSSLVGIWHYAGLNSDAAAVLKEVKPPDWLFPTMQRMDIQGRANDEVIRYYWDRIPIESDTFVAHFLAVPWRAWLIPAVAWGILVALLSGAMLCLAVVFRRQWVENERLPYPLANVYLSVIETPPPGKVFNALFRNRWFWIAALTVFSIHSLNALNKYGPRVWPEIPIGFNFGNIFRNPPWSYLEWHSKSSTLFFCMIGITYFLQSNVALSLWLFYVVMQICRMIYGSYSADITAPMQQDQNLGSVLVFTGMILWVARHHLLLVGRQMFRRPKPGEAQGRYLPYFLAGWGLTLSLAGIIAWLCLAGTTLAGALLIVTMAGMLYLVVARVVAETGLTFVQLTTSMHRPWSILSQSMPAGWEVRTTLKSFFFTGWISNIFVYDQRESLSGFMPQALRVADGAAYEKSPGWRSVLPFTLCLLGALAVGYVVSGGAMLYTEYTYAATANRRQNSPINPYGVDTAVKGQHMDPTRDYMTRGGANDNHNRWLHMTVGGGITAVLSVLRLRFANWPLHPVGYLLVYSYSMQKMWFSIFVGWLVKVLILNYGGASMYRTVKPLFMGLIIGEVGAAAFWLVVSLVLNMLGLPYYAINLLPA